jgi:hypothetical protein
VLVPSFVRLDRHVLTDRLTDRPTDGAYVHTSCTSVAFHRLSTYALVVALTLRTKA